MVKNLHVIVSLTFQHVRVLFASTDGLTENADPWPIPWWTSEYWNNCECRDVSLITRHPSLVGSDEPSKGLEIKQARKLHFICTRRKWKKVKTIAKSPRGKAKNPPPSYTYLTLKQGAFSPSPLHYFFPFLAALPFSAFTFHIFYKSDMVLQHQNQVPY